MLLPGATIPAHASWVQFPNQLKLGDLREALNTHHGNSDWKDKTLKWKVPLLMDLQSMSMKISQVVLEKNTFALDWSAAGLVHTSDSKTEKQRRNTRNRFWETVLAHSSSELFRAAAPGSGGGNSGGYTGSDPLKDVCAFLAGFGAGSPFHIDVIGSMFYRSKRKKKKRRL